MIGRGNLGQRATGSQGRVIGNGKRHVCTRGRQHGEHEMPGMHPCIRWGDHQSRQQRHRFLLRPMCRTRRLGPRLAVRPRCRQGLHAAKRGRLVGPRSAHSWTRGGISIPQRPDAVHHRGHAGRLVPVPCSIRGPRAGGPGTLRDGPEGVDTSDPKGLDAALALQRTGRRGTRSPPK